MKLAQYILENNIGKQERATGELDMFYNGNSVAVIVWQNNRKTRPFCFVTTLYITAPLGKVLK